MPTDIWFESFLQHQVHPYAEKVFKMMSHCREGQQTDGSFERHQDVNIAISPLFTLDIRTEHPYFCYGEGNDHIKLISQLEYQEFLDFMKD